MLLSSFLEEQLPLSGCYITVDFATAVSQNGFRTFKLFFHKKTIIIQKVTKTLDYFLLLFFLSCTSHEIISLYDTFVELRKHGFVTQPLPNPPLCSSTVIKHLNGESWCDRVWWKGRGGVNCKFP